MKVEEQDKQQETQNKKQIDKTVEEEKPDYGNKRIEVKFTADRQRLGENREIETEKKEEEELNKNDQGKESVLNNPVNPREAPSEVPTITPQEIPDPQPPNEIPEISPVEVPEINPKEIPEKQGDEQGSGNESGKESGMRY